MKLMGDKIWEPFLMTTTLEVSKQFVIENILDGVVTADWKFVSVNGKSFNKVSKGLRFVVTR